MDLRNPVTAVIPGVRGLVLAVLARTTAPLTGRGIVALLDGQATQAGVQRALDLLVESGLVISTRAGRARLYELNRDHVGAPAVEAAADLRGVLLERLRGEMATWPRPPVAAWLFGSTARGDATAASDIDLLIVRPVTFDEDVWEAQVMDLAAKVRRWSGNSCEVLSYDEDELARLVGDDDPLIGSLRDDAISLTGRSSRSLLRRGSHPWVP